MKYCCDADKGGFRQGSDSYASRYGALSISIVSATTLGGKVVGPFELPQSIEEKDLTQAAQKINTYLKLNTVITPGQAGCQGGAPNTLKKQTRP